MADVPVGTNIWVRDKGVAWVRGSLLSREEKGSGFIFKASREDNGQEVEIECESADLASADGIKLCNTFEDGGSLAQVWDLTNLTHLHEPAVLESLCVRYDHNQIYTNTGPILLAVNPFKDLKETLYKETVLEQYYSNGLLKSQGLEVEPLAPHIFATGDAAYRSLVDSGDDMTGKNKLNQSILVSGESGAGKTVSTKFIMRYLATVACEENSEESKQIADMVLESNPILEAFGNARTIRNDNSSRFGKFIEMQFNTRGKLIGARIKTYLLEKVRIAQQAENERNFHIFYELCKGASDEQRESWKVPTLERCGITNMSNCYAREDGVEDDASFSKVIKAMEIMGFTEIEKEQIMRTVSGVMNLALLGFVQKTNEDDSKLDMENEETTTGLANVGTLLEIDAGMLEEALCIRNTKIGSETFKNALRVRQAKDGRDALIKTVYSRLFLWIVARVNQSIEKQAKGLNFIGVLDIFGFEVFVSNSFEQLCINYANETLQQQFNQFVFKLEQMEYEKEGITWSFIDFPDNQDTLTLIDGKPIGLLSLLDDQCMIPKGSDEGLARQYYEKLGGREIFSASSKEKVNFMFSIQHYAGKVSYDSQGFCEKNKDQLFQEALDLMQSTKSDLLRTLFPAGESASITASKSKALQAVTVGTQFKTQLAELLGVIKSTAPHYVRCLKPNDRAASGEIVRNRLVDQLRYGGVLEAVKVARAGYPVRMLLKDFCVRYFYLVSMSMQTSLKDPKKNSQLIVDALELQKLEDYQVGKTKLFLRKQAYEKLEERRSQVRKAKAISIQTVARRHAQCKLYRRMRESCLVLQRAVRVLNAKQKVRHLREVRSALTLQRCVRMSLAVRAYQKQREAFLRIQSMYRGAVGRKAAIERRRTLAQTKIATAFRANMSYKKYTSFRHAVVAVQCGARSKAARRVLRELKAEARNVGSLQVKLKVLQVKVTELQAELDTERELRVDAEQKRDELDLQVQTLMKLNSESVLAADEDEENETAPVEVDTSKFEEELGRLRLENKELCEQVVMLKEELAYSKSRSDSFDGKSSKSDMDFWKSQMNENEDQSRIYGNTSFDHSRTVELEEEVEKLKAECRSQRNEIMALQKANEKVNATHVEGESKTTDFDVEEMESLKRLCVKQEEQISKLMKESGRDQEFQRLTDLCNEQQVTIERLSKGDFKDEMDEMQSKLREAEMESKQLHELKSFQAGEIEELKRQLRAFQEQAEVEVETKTNGVSALNGKSVAPDTDISKAMEEIATENKSLKERIVKEHETCNAYLERMMEAENRANDREAESNMMQKENISLKSEITAMKDTREELNKKCKTLEQKMVAMETLAEQASGVKIALAKRLEELILENRSTSATLVTLKDKVSFYKDANKLLQDDLKETRKQLKQATSGR